VWHYGWQIGMLQGAIARWISQLALPFGPPISGHGALAARRALLGEVFVRSSSASDEWDS
jgi:hypothetical protein